DVIVLYLLSVWQTRGNAVVVRPGTHMHLSNRLDLQITGGAKYGDLGELRPVTLHGDALATGSVDMRGDIRAGTAASKIGLFGALPQSRSDGWSVAGMPDARNID